MDGDAISPDEAASAVAVIDMIEPRTAITAEHFHQQLAAEMPDPPVISNVRTVLTILRMPHVGCASGSANAARALAGVIRVLPAASSYPAA